MPHICGARQAGIMEHVLEKVNVVYCLRTRKVQKLRKLLSKYLQTLTHPGSLTLEYRWDVCHQPSLALCLEEGEYLLTPG